MFWIYFKYTKVNADVYYFGLVYRISKYTKVVESFEQTSIGDIKTNKNNRGKSMVISENIIIHKNIGTQKDYSCIEDIFRNRPELFI